VKEFFKNFFGIMTTKSEAKHVVLRADSEQAKYLRALPLHPSQRETMGDGYSDFDYHLCITYDFIQELLSKGSRIMVVAPAELKAAVVEELRKSLSNYEL
jgi:predicted DNA-binding transcriptional regulator YafY